MMKATFGGGARPAAMPRHLHPVPVVLFRGVRGFVGKIGEAPEARFKAGEASFAAGPTRWCYYRNVSASPERCLRVPGRRGRAELSAGWPETAP